MPQYSASRYEPSAAMRALMAQAGISEMPGGAPQAPPPPSSTTINLPRAGLAPPRDDRPIGQQLPVDELARINSNVMANPGVINTSHPAFRRAQIGYENQELDDAIRDQELRTRDLGFGEDLRDMSATRGAARHRIPEVALQDSLEYERAHRMATDPAKIAARGRETTAGTTGQYNLARTIAGRTTPEEILAGALDDWTRSGVFGIDPKTGAPNQPPDAIRAQAEQLLNNLFSGRGGQPGPAGAAPGGGGGAAPGPVAGTPAPAGGGGDIEGLISDLLSNGLARDRNDAIAGLKARGIIR